MQYKKGGEKQEWISNKITTLLEEDPNISQSKAVAIAMNLAENQFTNGGGYKVETDLKEYGVNATPIVQGDLNNVEKYQGYSGRGYGNQMQDVENTINTHDWYFKDDAQKEKFRQAVAQRGGSDEVRNFQNAYNQELNNRLSTSNLSEQDRNNIYSQSAFTNSGVQQADGKFGAFTSSRPMVNFNTAPNPQTPTEPQSQPTSNPPKLYKAKLFAEDMSDGNRDFENTNLNNYMQRKTAEQGGLNDKDIEYLQGVVNKHNDNLGKRYNNSESKTNKKAQDRFKKLSQRLEVSEVKENGGMIFQNGGFNTMPNFKPIEQPKVQGFGYDPNFQSQISPTSITAGEDFKKDNPLPQGTFQADPFGVSANKELETPKKTTENFQPMQFFNPYAGVDLAQGANALGQSIENGDALGIVAGGLKTLTGTARNIFGGMGQARVKNEGMKNYIVGKSQQGQNGGAFPNFQEGGAIYPMEEPTPYESFPNGVYEAPAQQFPTGIYQAPEVEATPTPSFDTNSARDTWVQKTGLPWSEAKKLGYTDGSAKDNKKLLSELNDPRFKKEYLRTEPIQKVTKTEAKKIIPKAEATPQLKKEQSIEEVAVRGKVLDGNKKAGVPFASKQAEREYYQNNDYKIRDKNARPVWNFNQPKFTPNTFRQSYQDGGEQQDPLQMVSEALQQGATEEQIAQILMQQGYSEEEIGQIFEQLQRQQSFQEGGEQQGQAEQIYQMVTEALQSGADPQEIAQQLMQMGLSEEEVMQIIQEVMSQMQQPVEPQQIAPQMKMGGSFDQLIGKKILGYEYNKDKDTYSVRYE